MNDYYSRLKITGNAEALRQFREQTFTYYSGDRIEEVIAIEKAHPERYMAVEYMEDMIRMFKDQGGGYYHFKIQEWEMIFGTWANVDLKNIDDTTLHVRIATGQHVDLEKLEKLSARHPALTFHLHQLRWHEDPELICVIRNGETEDYMWTYYEESKEQGSTHVRRSRANDAARSRMRVRIETLMENGQWELLPLRIVDEAMVYDGCDHDTDEFKEQVIYVY